MPFALPTLPYAYDALEPHIDAKTMEIHHTKHHQAYVDKVNKALEGTSLEGKGIEEVLQNLDTLPADKKKPVQNNGGGHFNHSLFWTIMGPPSLRSGQVSGGGEPTGDIKAAIDATFGSFAEFQKKFEETATNQFGSGWAWLYVDDKKLCLKGYPNQDSPIMEGKTPILGVDVWEHAYYLKYQNKRPDYLKAFWHIINWKEVERRFGEAR